MALLAQDIQKAYDPAGIKSEGSNFFLSNGAVAGQEVPHAHLHLAPRFTGDGHRMAFSKAGIHRSCRLFDLHYSNDQEFKNKLVKYRQSCKKGFVR